MGMKDSCEESLVKHRWMAYKAYLSKSDAFAASDDMYVALLTSDMQQSLDTPLSESSANIRHATVYRHTSFGELPAVFRRRLCTPYATAELHTTKSVKPLPVHRCSRPQLRPPRVKHVVMYPDTRRGHKEYAHD